MWDVLVSRIQYGNLLLPGAWCLVPGAWCLLRTHLRACHDTKTSAVVRRHEHGRLAVFGDEDDSDGMNPEDMAKPCSVCGGRGVVLKEMSSSASQRMLVQQHCAACKGEGTVLADGVTESREKETIEVVVEPGIRQGERISFAGQGDEKPGMLPGDVVFVVAEEQHPTFKRRGADLLLTKTISLADALCGVSFPVETLDGRTVRVEAAEGAVVKHQDVLAVQEEGMPVHGDPVARGRLFVVFDVEMPAAGSLTANEKALLGRILPGRTEAPAAAAGGGGATDNVDMPATVPQQQNDDIERVVLAPVDAKSFGMSSKGARSAEAYDSDDEDGMGGGFRAMGGGMGGGGGGVQCAQQ